MKGKRHKGYWEKKKETFTTGTEAKARAGYLRTYKHISHVVVNKIEKNYTVAYSIAKWYLEDMQRSGVTL